MANDVVLSSALRSNLLSLQGTQRSIDTTQLRLATGLKVNSALDSPSNFFTAKSLNNRASDLQRLLDGIGQSIRTIEAANTGVETLGALIEQAESIAQEAQSEVRSAAGFTRARSNVDLSTVSDLTNIGGGGTIVDGASDSFDVTVVEEDGTATSLTIDIDPNETVDNIVADINSDPALSQVATARVTEAGYLEIAADNENSAIRINSSAANGLTAAGFTQLGLDTVVGIEDAGGATVSGGTAIAGNTLTSGVSAGAQVNGKFEASDDLVTAGFLGAAGDDINLVLTVDGETVDAGQVTGADTIQDVVDRINNAGISTVEASFNTDTGQIELDFDDSVGQVELQYTDNGASTTSFGFGAGAGDAALGGNPGSEFFTFDGVSAEVDQYEEDYNELLTQIDDLIDDANYRGINLLGDDSLTTYFNEDGDSTLTTDGVDFTASGLGLEKADFTNANNVQLSIDRLSEATSRIRNFGRSIANDLSLIQTRRDFTENTVNTLQAGADDLTVADQNEEGANLLALQTRQQLGVTSLALAAESQQSVLRLF